VFQRYSQFSDSMRWWRCISIASILYPGELVFQSVISAKREDGVPGRVVGEFVALFDGEVISPVGYFNISFKVLYEHDWRSTLEMDIDLH
jgi:hypothetical protein